MKVQAHYFDVYKGVPRFRRTVSSGGSVLQNIHDVDPLYFVSSSILSDKFQFAVPGMLRTHRYLSTRYISSYIARCSSLSASFAFATFEGFENAVSLPPGTVTRLLYPQSHGQFDRKRALLAPIWELESAGYHHWMDLEIAPMAILLALQRESLQKMRTRYIRWVAANNEHGGKHFFSDSLRWQSDKMIGLIDQRVALCDKSISEAQEDYSTMLLSRAEEIGYLVSKAKDRLPKVRIHKSDVLTHQTTSQFGWIHMGAVRCLPLTAMKNPAIRLSRAHMAFEVAGVGPCVGYLDYFRAANDVGKGAYGFLSTSKMYRTPLYPAPILPGEPLRAVRKDLLKLENLRLWPSKVKSALLEVRKACHLPEFGPE
jgi:hypothetical protein